MYSSSVVQFNEQPLELLEVDGQRCLTAETIGKALDYSEPRKSVNNLFNRFRDEFEIEVDYSVTKLMTEDGKRETNIFFHTGVMLIGMFSKQPLAKEFRQWAKHVLAAVQYGESPTDDQADHLAYLERIAALQEELLIMYRREKREEEDRPFHEPYEPIRPDLKAYIRRLRARGYSYQQIADRTGVSKASAWLVIHDETQQEAE